MFSVHVDQIIEKFEKHLLPEPNSGCWLWLGTKDRVGYGHFYLSKNRPLVLAHRMAYELYKGNIPEGLNVLHRCDVTSCANPNHLFLGYHSDNMRDKVTKGRASSLKGENNPTSKLTWGLVTEIRSKYIPYKYSLYKLAKEYGVSVSVIHNIVTHKRWKHDI